MNTIYGKHGMLVQRDDPGTKKPEVDWRAEILRLAEFIDTDFPGELGADDLSTGANVVDTAIRILEQMTMWMAG